MFEKGDVVKKKNGRVFSNGTYTATVEKVDGEWVSFSDNEYKAKVDSLTLVCPAKFKDGDIVKLNDGGNFSTGKRHGEIEKRGSELFIKGGGWVIPNQIELVERPVSTPEKAAPQSALNVVMEDIQNKRTELINEKNKLNRKYDEIDAELCKLERAYKALKQL